MNNKKNPYAFPCVDDEYLQEGMTLTDYFAAKAIPSLIDRRYTSVYIARRSYEIADAMMKVRNERIKNDSEKI